MRSELLLAAAFLAASVPLGSHLDRLAAPRALPAIPGGLPAGDRLASRLAARKTRADSLWIDLLQYVADPSFSLDRGARLFRIAERITALDPGFVRVYMYAGSTLMWQCNRPAEAAALLERGITANPGEVHLKYYLAAFAYQRLKDLRSQIVVLEQLAFAPDAPIILRRILANAYEKQHDLGRAAAVWRLVAHTSLDPRERTWAERKLAIHGIALEPGTGERR